MMRNSLGLLPIIMTVVGCAGVEFEPYYPVRVDPVIGELSVTSQSGNVGSVEVTMTGSGFGDSADDVMVLFDNHNAEVVTVTDDQIVFWTPSGGISGGPVDVLVATGSGYAVAEDAFVYDIADYSDQEDGFYTGQEGYIKITNLYESCYGGVGPAGCENVTFNGDVGLDGQAEFLRFAYPRLHTTHQGWLSAADSTVEGWNIYPPDPPYASGFDNLRERVGNFQLVNAAWAGDDVCVDMEDDFHRGPKDCSESSDYLRYDPSVLQFCEGEDATDGGTYEYAADWPVNRDFFQGEGAPDDPVLVQLNLSERGLSGLDLMLPPPMRPEASSGFPSASGWWQGNIQGCLDGDRDGESTLSEDGVIFEWTPSDPVYLLENSGIPEEAGGVGVVDINTYIHVSVTYVEFSWYGLELVGFRGATTVPDDNAFNEETGKASVGIPNWVMYQLPSPNGSWSSYDEFTRKGKLGNYNSRASYVFMEVYRITDYRLETSDGPIVLSYVTGDLTIPSWDNPIGSDATCGDCVDGDGDGWVDSLDPDCNADKGGEGEEINPTSIYSCNDGIDNDNNGLIDNEDPLCKAGWDGETTCGDGVDNDGDGWIDALDADCDDLAADQEDGSVANGTCADGLDNDADGWTDAEDPICIDGRTDETDGYGTSACNDGIDNDGNNDIDREDPYCAAVGATGDSEEPTYISKCADGDDNDDDKFIDGLDPDCEYYPHSRESSDFHDPAEYPLVTACYDGIDNDGDGRADGGDPSCWSPGLGYMADGFLDDESADFGTGCTDGTDDDGDGWPDGLDPDCVMGDPTSQTEVGYNSAYVCNDGIDNDGDTLVDADDPDCSSAYDNFEGG